MINKFINYLVLKKMLIFLIPILFIPLFFIITSVLPNVYKSKTILMIETSIPEENNFLGSYSSLIGIQSSQNLTSEVIETINSFNFYNDRLFEENDAQYLIAYKFYDPTTKKEYFKQDLFEPTSNKWLRKKTKFKDSKPSTFEVWEAFTKKNLKTILNRENGFIELQVTHQSPVYAFNKLTRLVEELDQTFFDRDKKYLIRLNELLENEITNSKVEVREALNERISVNLKKIASMEANDQYLIKEIEPPYIEEEPFSPRTSTKIFIAAFFSFLIYLTLGFIGFVYKEDKEIF